VRAVYTLGVKRPIETILDALEDAGVRYLVVGGVAVVLHGHLRFTADLDLVLDLDEANLLRAVDALEGLGFRPRPPVPFRAFADADTRRGWVETKGLTVFSVWSPRFPGTELDLFVEAPFEFAEAYAEASLVSLDDGVVHVVSLTRLIEMKERVGRPRDRADVEALRAIARETATRGDGLGRGGGP